MTALLSMKDVCFSYGPRSALSEVTLTVRAGEVLVFVGPNGAGKTTLLKMLAGLLAPQSGVVRAADGGRRAVAYLAQGEELPGDWAVREVVELGRMPHVGFWRDLTAVDERAVHAAMERTRVSALAGRRIATLSGGERQRVALARALAQEPSVLLLDEPTTHLDLRHQMDLLGALRAEATRGIGVVAVLHDLGFAARADRCVLLSRGSVRADGPPARVLVPDLLREVYEIEVNVTSWWPSGALDGRDRPLAPEATGASTRPRPAGSRR
jgi:iron complex transport system ATP-binding protein